MDKFKNIGMKSINFVYMTILILYTSYLCSCIIIPVLYFVVNIFHPLAWSLAELYNHLPQGFSMYKGYNSGWVLFWLISVLFLFMARKIAEIITKKVLKANITGYIFAKSFLLIPLMIFFFYVVYNPKYVLSTVLFLNDMRYVGFLIGIPIFLYLGFINEYLINLFTDKNMTFITNNPSADIVKKLLKANSMEELEENLAWFNETVKNLYAERNE